jgi:hypothetical protein
MDRASATPRAIGVPFAQAVDGQLAETQGDLFSAAGYSPYANRWPRSGICLHGLYFARPTSVPRTNETGYSSSPSMPLLLSPTANLAINGGSQPMAKRRAGGHGPTLADQLEHEIPVLPTPRTTDRGALDRPSPATLRGTHGRDLAPTVGALLPTPSAAVVNDGETVASWEARQARLLAKGYNGNGMGTPLTVAVARLLPTPAAREVKGPGTGTPGRVRADGRVRTDRDATLGLAIGALTAGPGGNGATNPDGGTPRGGRACRLPRGPGPTTPATPGGRLLPTPQAHDKQGPKTAAQQEAGRARGLESRGRRHGVSNLNETALRLTGSSTPPPSPGGRPSSDGGPLTLFDLPS